jgi:hypothetical protein
MCFNEVAWSLFFQIKKNLMSFDSIFIEIKMKAKKMGMN